MGAQGPLLRKSGPGDHNARSQKQWEAKGLKEDIVVINNTGTEFETLSILSTTAGENIAL